MTTGEWRGDMHAAAQSLMAISEEGLLSPRVDYGDDADTADTTGTVSSSSGSGLFPPMTPVWGDVGGSDHDEFEFDAGGEHKSGGAASSSIPSPASQSHPKRGRAKNKRADDDDGDAAAGTRSTPTPSNKRGRPKSKGADGVTKRPRGRPRKVPLTADQQQQQLMKRQQQAVTSETADQLVKFPPEMTDLDAAGALDFNISKEETRLPALQAAEKKFAQVYEGRFAFGQPVVIESFEFNDAPLLLPAIISNIIVMSVLFSKGALETKHGKVSVFPVTVYRNAAQAAAQQQGYPCVALHVGQFKVLCWRVFSACRKIVSNSSICNGFSAVASRFNPPDDGPLTRLAGVEEYTNPKLHAMGGFLLLSAKWLDVMKSFFVQKDFGRRDIGVLFRSVYSHTPSLKDKFSDMFRVIWLGMEREANVNSMLRLDSPISDHFFSMTRCRAASGAVRIGPHKSGPLWVINPPKNDAPISYSSLSFCYGVQCWREQLVMLNSAFVYFTSTEEQLSPMLEPRHMAGLTCLEETPLLVLDRVQCLRQGLLDDRKAQGEEDLVRHLRNARKALANKYGSSILSNFFGV